MVAKKNRTIEASHDFLDLISYGVPRATTRSVKIVLYIYEA